MQPTQQKLFNKDKKVDLYHYVQTDKGLVKNHLCTKRLLYAYIRDISVGERSSYAFEPNQSHIITYLNHNKLILEMYKHAHQDTNPLFLQFRDRTFVIVAKPDEYEYNKGDMKVVCEEKVDNHTFVDEIYLE
jgi:hypothetical protein